MKYLFVLLFLVACASKKEKQCTIEGGQFHDNLCWNTPLPKDLTRNILVEIHKNKTSHKETEKRSK